MLMGDNKQASDMMWTEWQDKLPILQCYLMNIWLTQGKWLVEERNQLNHALNSL